MSMIGGTVTVAKDESYTGSGLALALFEAKRAASPNALSDITKNTTGSAYYKTSLENAAKAKDDLAKIDPSLTVADLAALEQQSKDMVASPPFDVAAFMSLNQKIALLRTIKVPLDTAKTERDMRLATLRGWATEANVIGPVIVDYFKANASVPLTAVVATIDTTTSAGRAPSPLVAGAPIQGPASPVDLVVTGPSGATFLPIE